MNLFLPAHPKFGGEDNPSPQRTEGRAVSPSSHALLAPSVRSPLWESFFDGFKEKAKHKPNWILSLTSFPCRISLFWPDPSLCHAGIVPEGHLVIATFPS